MTLPPNSLGKKLGDDSSGSYSHHHLCSYVLFAITLLKLLTQKLSLLTLSSLSSLWLLRHQSCSLKSLLNIEINAIKVKLIVGSLIYTELPSYQYNHIIFITNLKIRGETGSPNSSLTRVLTNRRGEEKGMTYASFQSKHLLVCLESSTSLGSPRGITT